MRSKIFWNLQRMIVLYRQRYQNYCESTFQACSGNEKFENAIALSYFTFIGMCTCEPA